MFCNKNYYYANEKIEINLKLNPQFKSKNFKSVVTIHDFNHQKVGTVITDIKGFFFEDFGKIFFFLKPPSSLHPSKNCKSLKLSIRY